MIQEVFTRRASFRMIGLTWKMKFFYRPSWPLIVLIPLLITACTPTQRPLKNGEGYVAIAAGDNHYRIEYFSKSKKIAEDFWKTTAEQLCPDGYESLYSKQDVLQFDMYVPIAGNNVNLGRQEFIQSGEVKCNGNTATEVTLIDSRWREFNKETQAIKPVSERWLTEVLKLYVAHLPKLPAQGAVEQLTEAWGKPTETHTANSGSVSIWQKGGDSWFPNQVALIEREGCLRTVVLIPGVSAFIMGQYKGKDNMGELIDQLVTSGAIPTYFYKTGFCHQLNHQNQ